jgi:hypothetical protein
MADALALTDNLPVLTLISLPFPQDNAVRWLND